MDDPLGAFVTYCEVRLEGIAEGPLSGLTFAAKDLYDVAGTVTGCGNPDWIRTHPPAETTAPVIEKLVAAGATLVGKTLTDELAYSLNGENHHFGTPVNVNAPGRIPGGSSNGSAAAVAGGLVDFALGSDTGGSVRVPASFCGLYGLRPTHGRIPLEGIQPLAPSFDTIGWFARDPELLRRVASVVMDLRPVTMPRTVLMPADLWALAEDATRDALGPPLHALAQMVGDTERAALAAPGPEACFEAFRVLQGKEIWRVHGEWVRRVKPDIGPGIAERLEWTSTLTAADGTAAQAVRDMVLADLGRRLTPDVVVAAPIAPGPAPVRDAPPGAVDDTRRRLLTLTCFAGLAGLPQISLPLAEVDGLPVGFSLIAGPGGDETLLELARRLLPDT